MIRSIALVLMVPVVASAQFDAVSRFELGQRLRDFERALDRHNQPDAIRRAIPPVAKATPAFFSGNLGEAGKILDVARLMLADANPDPARLWALSMSVRPGRRVVDVAAGKLAVKVDRFYKHEAASPEGTQLRLSLRQNEKMVVRGPAMVLNSPKADAPRSPGDIEWRWDKFRDGKLPEGDYDLVAEVMTGETVLTTISQTVSLIANLDARLAALKKRETTATVEDATRVHLLSLITDLAAGKTLETNYPAHRLLVEAESLAGRAGKSDQAYYTAERAGQFWLALPGVSGSPVRIEVPRDLKKGVRVPVVIALHGAGGSENMFFDGYGDGIVAKLAIKRGWFVVATRSGFFSGPDVPAVVDALAKIYPIDTSRVFIVGHSMGAAQTAASVGRTPERYAAAACLGGGGGVKASDALKKVPFFVGVGQLDFAATGAKRLSEGLTKAGVEKVVFRAYEHLEHLTIVQLALPEVFAFFDMAAKK